MAPLPDPPFVSSVLHPTDFSAASETAFAHALAIAVARKCDLRILHVNPDLDGDADWTRFPSVRGTLERWGLLAPGSPRSAVFEQLSVAVTKVAVRGRSALTATLEYLDLHPTSLIVLATEGRHGPPRWIRPSVAERLGRRSHIMTLFVPAGARGFVSPADGSVSLRRILVPVDHEPHPHAALVSAARAAAILGAAPVEILLLHVGDPERLPPCELPDAAGCEWRWLVRQGDVLGEILGAAHEDEPDVIAMATEGHQGILDALRGSVTEQVVRRAPCAVLAVPAG
jgi:nucleotide-binding universal stress UspA family protein